MMVASGAAVSRPHALWRLRRELTLGKGASVAILLLLVLRSVVVLLTPWPLKLIIDSVIYQKPLWRWLAPFLPNQTTERIGLLTCLGVGLLLLGAVENALTYHSDRLLLIAGQRAVFQLRSRLFGHLQRLSLSFHRRQRIGDLMAKLGGDIQTLQDFLVSSGVGVFSHLLSLIGMAAILLMIDWRYALVVIAAAPTLLWITQRYRKRVKAALRCARHKESEVWSLVQENLSAIQVVQAYGRETAEEARFGRRVTESLGATLEATSLQLKLPRLIGFVVAVATALTLWFGTIEVLNGVMTAGELLVFLAYLRAMATPIRQVAKTVSSVGKAEVAAERIGELLAEVSEVRDANPALRPQACTGSLEFRSVCFSYRPEQQVLKDISFRACVGQVIALVGTTGAGKSTIASLVPRFYDPTRGEILLDGVDLRRLSLEFLRAQIALVTQEPILFSGTVWQNIAYGRADADRAAAITAAQAVGVHDLIQTLALGYDTPIGERGAALSGGQRQFISVARAMLRNAPIVILDEPSSGLDAVTEFRLGAAVRRLMVGRTTLVIAHRLTTVASADSILVIDEGRIVQSGSHKDLLQKGGRYAELWHRGGNVLRSPAREDPLPV